MALGFPDVLSVLKFFGEELKADQRNAFILFLVLLSCVQYYNNDTVRSDYKSYVEKTQARIDTMNAAFSRQKDQLWQDQVVQSATLYGVAKALESTKKELEDLKKSKNKR